MQLLPPDPDWTLLDRYWSGGCTPEEAQSIDAWASSDPSHAQVLESMRRVWVEAASTLPVINEDVAWRALDERLRAAPSPLVRRATPGMWRWVALAACVVGAATAGVFTWRRYASERQLAAERPAQEYATSRGARSDLTLVDGTRVWLSVNSSIHLPQGYGAASRDVALSGEAYFVVKHDARRPFRVRTDNGVTEDLGTAFDVRSYPGDMETVVIVASGRVALRDSTLRSGQMGMLDQHGGVRVMDHIDVDAALAWRNGELRFEDRPFRDVIRDLERWYDIDIATDDSALLMVPVTASFTGQSADEALAILAATLGVHVTRDGRHVRVHHPHPHPR